jgi:hypothetical protein
MNKQDVSCSTMSHSSLRAYGEAISVNIALSRLLRHYAPRNDTCLKCDIVKVECAKKSDDADY